MKSNYSGTYQFRCPCNRSQLLHLLNQQGLWNWKIRDGEYSISIFTRPDGGATHIHIFGDGPEFVIETTYDPLNKGLSISFEKLHDTILKQILPNIGATNIIRLYSGENE